jgi:hypothetical protein
LPSLEEGGPSPPGCGGAAITVIRIPGPSLLMYPHSPAQTWDANAGRRNKAGSSRREAAEGESSKWRERGTSAHQQK